MLLCFNLTKGGVIHPQVNGGTTCAKSSTTARSTFLQRTYGCVDPARQKALSLAHTLEGNKISRPHFPGAQAPKPLVHIVGSSDSSLPVKSSSNRTIL